MTPKLKTDNIIEQLIDEHDIFEEYIPTTDDTLPAEIRSLIENVNKK